MRIASEQLGAAITGCSLYDRVCRGELILSVHFNGSTRDRCVKRDYNAADRVRNDLISLLLAECTG